MDKTEYKDMSKFKANRSRYNLRYEARHNYSRGKRRRWTEEEEMMLISHDRTRPELAKALGRSMRAVRIRTTLINNK